jgi:hypothetical protein
MVPAVTLYRLSGLAVLIGMTIMGIASVLYSRAGGVALYLDPLVPADDLAKLFGSLIFLIGLPGLYAFQAARAGRLGLAGFVLSFFGLAMQRSAPRRCSPSPGRRWQLITRLGSCWQEAWMRTWAAGSRSISDFLTSWLWQASSASGSRRSRPASTRAGPGQ